MQPAEAPSGTHRSSPLYGASPAGEEPDGSVPVIASTGFKMPTPEEISKEWRLLDSMVVKEPHDDAFRMLRYPTAMQPNKWKDVLPDESTRVKLECTDEDWCSTDYINANHISSAKGASGMPLPGVPSYIACQAPTLDTVSDFWRMIWQQHVPVIVMLTRLTEGSKSKATQYWPQWLNQPTSYGRVIVTLMNEEFLSGNCSAIIRSLRIEQSAALSTGEPARVLFHLHYEEWPDFGVPESTRLLRDVLAYVDMLQSHWPQACAAALAGVALQESLLNTVPNSPLLSLTNTSPLSRSASLATPLSGSASSASLSATSSMPSLHSGLLHSSSSSGISREGSGLRDNGVRTSSAVPVPRRPSSSSVPGSRKVSSTSTSSSSSSTQASRKASGGSRTEAILSPRGGSGRASGSGIGSSTSAYPKRHSLHGTLTSSSTSNGSVRAPPDPSLVLSPHPRTPLARSVPVPAVHPASSPSLCHSKRLSLAQSDPEERQPGSASPRGLLNTSGSTVYTGSPTSSASNSPRSRSRSASDLAPPPAAAGPNFGPLVFHCSAGIGRAGTLLAIHISLERLRHGLEVTVAETVHELRQQRRGMVQNEEQYAFIYRVLADIVNEKQREERMKRRGGDDLRSTGMHNSPPNTIRGSGFL